MGKLKLLLTLFIVLVVTSLINQTVVKNTQKINPEKEVASEATSPTPTASPTTPPAPSVTQSPEEKETIKEPSPTSVQQQSNYVYPGASVTASSDGALILTSPDTRSGGR